MKNLVLVLVLSVLFTFSEAYSKNKQAVVFAKEREHYNPCYIYHKDSLDKVFTLITLPKPIGAYGKGKFVVKLEVSHKLKKVLKTEKLIPSVINSKDETGWEFQLFSKIKTDTAALCYAEIKELIEKLKNKNSLKIKFEIFWVHPDYKIEKKSRFRQGELLGKGEFSILP